MDLQNERFQLSELSTEQLRNLLESGDISWSDWAEAQPDLYGGYQDWLGRNGLERNDENALRFIILTEENDMTAATGADMDRTMTTVEKARAVLARHKGA